MPHPHEYGMRVGFWRIRAVLAEHGVIPTLAINGQAGRTYPRIAEAAREDGWEFMGHGFVQQPMHKVEDQRAAIRATIAAIRDVTGVAPRGWESPGLTETDETIDLLAEEGIEYVADWVLDDQPVVIATRAGPIVSVQYSVEINDVAVYAVRRHAAGEYARRAIAQFDRLYAESAASARVMAVSMHPYRLGVPHRIAEVEAVYRHVRAHAGVALWTGAQILDWYRGSVGATGADRCDPP